MAETTEIIKIEEKVIVTTSPVDASAPNLPMADLSMAVVKAEPTNKKPPPIEFPEAATVTEREKQIAKFHRKCLVSQAGS